MRLLPTRKALQRLLWTLVAFAVVLIPNLFSVEQLYRTGRPFYCANAFDRATHLSCEGSLARSSTCVADQPMLPTHTLLCNLLARSA